MVDKSMRFNSGKSTRSVDSTGCKRSEFGGDRVSIAAAVIGFGLKRS